MSDKINKVAGQIVDGIVDGLTPDAPAGISRLVAELGREAATAALAWAIRAGVHKIQEATWPDGVKATAEIVTFTDERPA